jgi:hypothetical protein
MFGALLATPSAALALAYTYSCHTPVNYDYQHYISRSGGNQYVSVIGDADVRTATPCSNLDPSEGNLWTGVLPANLQSASGIVQVGYMRCVVAGGETGCGTGTNGAKVPGDGAPHFFYICNATSGGDVCRADNWGTLTTPIVGHRYRFSIAHTGSSWKYTITDKGTGATGSKTIPDGGWSIGSSAWWGAEGYDFNSMLGPKDTDSDIHMYWMQYQLSGSSSWWVAHPIARQKCEFSLLSHTCTGAWPAHFDYTIYNQNYTDGDAVNFFTSPH